MEFKNSVILLNPGMYVLRHSGEQGVLFVIAQGPGLMAGQGKLEVVGTPGTHNSRLNNKDDCIVAHVYDGDVELLVTACTHDAKRISSALRLDKIALGDSTKPTRTNPATENRPTLAELAKSMRASTQIQSKSESDFRDPTALFIAENNPSGTWQPTENVSSTLVREQSFPIPNRGLSLIGHIEALGDKVALPGDILIGESGQDLRLEGFQLNWPDIPDGLALSYSVRLESVQNELRASLGEFCGTRGQARRIIALSFNLSGLNAHQYRLDGYAYFSGGFKVPLCFGMKIGGPSGFEHLTGLQLEIR